MEHVIGEVKNIIFRSEENGYTVLSIAKRNAAKFEDMTTFRAIGIFPFVSAGINLEMEGYWETHPKHGEQFKILKYVQSQPKTSDGLMAYLTSRAFKGVGPVIAERIVDRFGDSALDVIENHYEKLTEIKGISKKLAQQMHDNWTVHKEENSVMVFLHNIGLSSLMATKVYSKFGKETKGKITKNPYLLIEIEGVSFTEADTVAMRMGISPNSELRVVSGITYTLQLAASKGHCFLEEDILIRAASKILSVPCSIIEEVYRSKSQRFISVNSDAGEIVYLPKYYHAERHITQSLHSLMAIGNDIVVSAGDIPSADPDTEIEYDEDQLRAIKEAINNKVFAITGGPGTGKTTIIKGIVHAYTSRSTIPRTINLAAPTGRAAKRMTDVIGIEAKTIHRLLEAHIEETRTVFNRNSTNPLEGELLIIDECSMIDVALMGRLLDAVPYHMHVIFVGDVDQLPSIGPGKVFSDILDSGVIPSVKLSKIFRQSNKSSIAVNARKIRDGEMLDTENGSDFIFIPRFTQDATEHTVVITINKLLKLHKNLTIRDIQVITPVHGGQIGTDSLNEVIKNQVNPLVDGKVDLEFGKRHFRDGDKVMQITNNYEKLVFNGDIGYVRHVILNGDNKGLMIDFDGRIVQYKYNELNEIVLAYAITVHKSQGCEFPIVILPIVSYHGSLLQRTLLYTAVTRAQKYLILVGEESSIKEAISNNDTPKRNSRLKELLRKE